jgi:hypothetical protein
MPGEKFNKNGCFSLVKLANRQTVAFKLQNAVQFQLTVNSQQLSDSKNW